jgi:hypothetical protein
MKKLLNHFRSQLGFDECERVLFNVNDNRDYSSRFIKKQLTLESMLVKHCLDAQFSICNRFVKRHYIEVLRLTTAELHEKSGKLILQHNKKVKSLTEKEADAYKRFGEAVIKLIMTQSGIASICETKNNFHYFVIEALCRDAVKYMILKTIIDGRKSDFDVWTKIETDAQILRTKLQKHFVSMIKEVLQCNGEEKTNT